MFNINALIKFINKNNDDLISRKEIQTFQQSQKSNSIFSEYFDSINSDVKISEFTNNIYEIYDKNAPQAQLEFKSKKEQKKYNQLVKEQYEQELQNIKKICMRFHLWKVSNEKEFDKLFNKFLKECKDNPWQILSMFEEYQDIKTPISIESYKKIGQQSLEIPTNFVFSKDIDWSNSREIFKYLSFNEKTFSDTPSEHLPKGYNPQEVFAKGKSIGLGIDKVHSQGFTGKGVSVAICDWQLKPHKDLNVQEYHCAEYASQVEDYFHASAVTGILAGKQTGVAPEVNVYFYAEYQDNSENGGNDLINTFKSIIEKNKSLPEGEKIRVISISGSPYGDETEVNELIVKLENSGVWVLTSPEFFENFGYLAKKDPMVNSDDFNNYQIANGDIDALFVNSGDRTVPTPESEESYRHDSHASASWAIPVVAGYYALACQADPSIDKDKFIKLAGETAKIVSSTKPELEKIGNDAHYEKGRSEKTYDIKIIDIEALLKAIEDKKQKSSL